MHSHYAWTVLKPLGYLISYLCCSLFSHHLNSKEFSLRRHTVWFQPNITYLIILLVWYYITYDRWRALWRDIAARNLCPLMWAFDFFEGVVAVARYLPVAKTIRSFPRNGAIHLNDEDGGGEHILPRMAYSRRGVVWHVNRTAPESMRRSLFVPPLRGLVCICSRTAPDSTSRRGVVSRWYFANRISLAWEDICVVWLFWHWALSNRRLVVGGGCIRSNLMLVAMLEKVARFCSDVAIRWIHHH